MRFGLDFIKTTEHISPRVLERHVVEVIGVNDNIEFLRHEETGITIRVTRHGFGLNRSAAQEAMNTLDLNIVQHGDTVRVEARHSPSPFSNRV